MDKVWLIPIVTVSFLAGGILDAISHQRMLMPSPKLSPNAIVGEIGGRILVGGNAPGIWWHCIEDVSSYCDDLYCLREEMPTQLVCEEVYPHPE